MTVKIKKQLVSTDVIKERSYGYGNKKKCITIHETANTNKGANAQAHANLQSRKNPSQASWHYQVDDKEIIQSFPDDVMCWSAGDGRGPGNTQSIHIEICVNSDGDFIKAVLNTADLVKYLMDKYNIPIDNVVQHYKWSGKNCPANLRNASKGISWDGFKNLLKQLPSQKDDKMYYVQVGAFKVKSNAEKCLKEAKKYFPDAFIKTE